MLLGRIVSSNQNLISGGADPLHGRATQLLLLATMAWGLSFPVIKALLFVQQRDLPDADSWFLSSLCLFYRFGAAALVLALWKRETLFQSTSKEWQQGLGLIFFGSIGLILQMDGLAYIPASTSAFLTQLYCVSIPVYVAVMKRRLPSITLCLCVGLVMAGVAVLSDVRWSQLRLGRGELETMLCAIIFSGQILWLERPCYKENNMSRVSVIMFAGTSLAGLPLALWKTKNYSDWVAAFGTPASWGFVLVLVLFCTLLSYLLMNYWQVHVTATEAGLIYAAEPVFASCFSLFLPAFLARWSSIVYLNEELTWRLLAGGGLIVFANILVQTTQHNAPNASEK